MDNKKIPLIAGVIGLGVMGLIMSIVLGIYFLSNSDEEFVPEQDIIIDDIKTPLEELFPEEDVVFVDGVKNQYEAIQSDSTTPLTEVDARRIYLSVNALVNEFKFNEAFDTFANEIEKYSFSHNPELFRELDDMQRDLSKMAQLPYVLENGETEIALDIINSLESPENHMLATFTLARVPRESIIRNEDSLNPILNDDFKINGIQYLPEYEENTVYDIFEVAKVSFTVDNNQLIADYLFTTNGLLLYKIYEKDEGSTNYMTIKRWREVMNPNISIDESQEESSDSELINEEVTDEE